MSSNIPTFDHPCSILSSLPDDTLHLEFDAYPSSLPTQSSAFLDLLCLDRHTYSRCLTWLYHTIGLTHYNHLSFFKSYGNLLQEYTFSSYYDPEGSDTSFFVPRLGTGGQRKDR
ncbi:LOW QUALITY PROTEIN: hypothetical protein L202_03933 [Cryptococcus amylolentus CBS 6039]|uniref:Uncharacterized protein n=1 Tax=Cryptococcus amylolentus CBS 6039 TaxID=1295533 RepID=A0A1E3HRH1_9TREE|nr:LOW QUALITY PROTEIN: hypothetical protein L202_03933 [Cryptococcus amylolentus CBS 6039]ODN78286.1 LOW QUALITY PROTEIN: hypothetical protein L202_03933 [Cryptococcus amylolentus CBS 6039]